MRRSIVDLGSHSFHALVADVDEVGVRNVVAEKKLAVRVGERAFGDGAIPADSIARAHDALSSLVALTGRRATAVATGVFRDASNGAAVLDELTARHGIAIELLSGDDEARLTWIGVSAELAGSHGRLAVLDLGGGSLECVAGTSTVEITHTLPLGVLRKPSRADAIAIARDALADVRAYRPETLALASGTARALLRLARQLGLARSGQRHVARRMFGELARVVAPMPAKTLAALGVEPARVDTIASGATVLDAALEIVGAKVVYVARSALREGALIDGARRAARRAA
jgi:exopolyphosphatase/guanosine-5'-triphosphate,3'-diphosphate pyrophosphatase